MNSIVTSQDGKAFQRLLRARGRFYDVAARFQIAQLILSVVLPLIGALLVAFVWPERRPEVAIAALAITILDVILIDRVMRKYLAKAAKASEQFDCELLDLPWNTFVAGKRVPPEDVSTASTKWNGKAEKILGWYPSAVSRAPMHIARLVCQLANLWYDTSLRKIYSILLLAIGSLAAVAYLAIGIVQKLDVGAWANNVAIAAPIVIWTVREYFRQHDTLAAIEIVKGTAERMWDKVKDRTLSVEDATQGSRDFQNALYIRRAANPLLFPFIYRVLRTRMEGHMKVSAEDRLADAGY